MKTHLRIFQSGVTFCLCLVAVRKRIYGLRQTQNASGVFFQEDLKSIISFVKEYYYLDAKYKTKNGIEYVLNKIG